MNVMNFLLFLTFSIDIFLKLTTIWRLFDKRIFFSLDSNSGKEPQQMLSSVTFKNTPQNCVKAVTVDRCKTSLCLEV